jgi:hypothetical protein
MSKDYKISDILKAWQKYHNLTDETAAERITAGKSTYKGWKAGKPISNQTLQRPTFWNALGARSFDDARIKYVAGTSLVRVCEDFEAREERLRTLFEGATEVRETRIMLPQYQASELDFRGDLNLRIRERIKAKTLSVFKLEQINCLDRAIDIINNVEEFSEAYYEVRILRYSQFLPYWNFMIFDNATTLAGGSGKLLSPRTDSSIEYVGGTYSSFYRKFWDQIWNGGDVITLSKVGGFREGNDA